MRYELNRQASVQIDEITRYTDENFGEADFKNEVQVIATVMSLEPNVEADIVSLLGASAALCISGIPFAGPVGAWVLKVEFPAGSGKMLDLWEVSQELSRRLSHIFLLDENKRRPVWGETEKFQRDEHFRDHVLFYEYFHGDKGSGVGASHQTGWTGLVAKLLKQSGE